MSSGGSGEGFSISYSFLDFFFFGCVLGLFNKSGPLISVFLCTFGMVFRSFINSLG